MVPNHAPPVDGLRAQSGLKGADPIIGVRASGSLINLFTNFTFKVNRVTGDEVSNRVHYKY